MSRVRLRPSRLNATLSATLCLLGCSGPSNPLSELVTAVNASTLTQPTTTEFVRVSNEYAANDAVLRYPTHGSRKVALVYTHPFASTNLVGFFCETLPVRGYAVLCINNRFTNNQQLNTAWEQIALDVASGVKELRSRGYEKVLLVGYSAGGPTMAYYQALAERGNALFRSGGTLSGFTGFRNRDNSEQRMPPADGVILVNPSSGIGASGMFRLDGSIIDEETGARDPSLDMYSAANGFDAARGVATYSRAFLDRYYAAQCARMNRLIDTSVRRIAAVKAGTARFGDDDIGVTVGLRANPAYVDLSLASSTRGSHLLLPSGAVTTVSNDRRASNLSVRNRGVDEAARTDSSFLSYRAVRCVGFNPDGVTKAEHGLDVTSSNNVTYANMESVSVPTLIMQGTADNTIVHLTVAELIFNSTLAASKDLWFVKGMTHGLTALSAADGDVPAITANAIGNWIDTRVR
jgi:pimeloyl-ACP methyl ester carboxylesterase